MWIPKSKQSQRGSAAFVTICVVRIFATCCVSLHSVSKLFAQPRRDRTKLRASQDRARKQGNVSEVCGRPSTIDIPHGSTLMQLAWSFDFWLRSGSRLPGMLRRGRKHTFKRDGKPSGIKAFSFCAKEPAELLNATRLLRHRLPGYSGKSPVQSSHTFVLLLHGLTS